MYRNAATGFGESELFVVHGASCVTGIDLDITLAPVSSKEPLQAGPRWRGKWRPQGGIGLGGGELHLNGTHWSSLLIQRKDRVPNGNVCTIQRLCAASLDRFDVGGQWALTLNPRPTPTGQYPDSCDPSEWNWVGRPLYRPCDNLLCFMPGWQS
jgi:hypothetical protein